MQQVFQGLPPAFHVLVAEDNPVNQKLVEDLLHKMNCTVEMVAKRA